MKVDEDEIILRFLGELTDDPNIKECIIKLLENQRKSLPEKKKEENLKEICINYSKKMGK